jgi:hypothetical protein
VLSFRFSSSLTEEEEEEEETEWCCTRISFIYNGTELAVDQNSFGIKKTQERRKKERKKEKRREKKNLKNRFTQKNEFHR